MTNKKIAELDVEFIKYKAEAKASMDALEKKIDDGIEKLEASIKAMKEESNAKFEELRQLILGTPPSQSTHVDHDPQITKAVVKWRRKRPTSLGLFALWRGNLNKLAAMANISFFQLFAYPRSIGVMSLNGFHKDETVRILAKRPIMVAAMAGTSSLIYLAAMSDVSTLFDSRFIYAWLRLAALMHISLTLAFLMLALSILDLPIAGMLTEAYKLDLDSGISVPATVAKALALTSNVPQIGTFDTALNVLVTRILVG
ncbi:hypothetical protein Tco_0856167 [Tanacetum coccineum]